jgi:hypothetical protein
MPRRYEHFLDYASERILLRKVGGGYIFVHRLLMGYFASLYSNSTQTSLDKEGITMPFTHGHALIIGVGNYQHSPRHSVPVTATDAQAIATIVQDARLCGYPTNQVVLLNDGNATRTGMLSALDKLAGTNSKDTVLLFYSGHGDYDTNGNYTLTTHDTRWQSGRVVPGTAISQTELLDKLRAIPAERVLLLFNACHAGELSPTLGDEPPPTGSALPQQTANALLSTGSGRIIITACRENQVAFIGSGKHTLFVKALVEGLRGSGEVYNRSGYISAFDLYTHLYYALDEAVQREVSQRLRDQYGTKQEPELTILKGVGPFAVALYRGAMTLGDFPTDHRPAEDAAVREVPESRSQRALQHISGTGAVGVVGDANAPITTGDNNTVITSGRDTIQAGRDVTQVGGDYVGGDKISGDINVRGVSGSGINIGHKGQAQSQQGGDADAFARAFAQVYQAINTRPDDTDVERDEITETVRSIEEEARKGDQANEKKLTRWLRTLAGMAGDIFDVTVAALTGPQAAVATVARKVAAKAKQEREQG